MFAKGLQGSATFVTLPLHRNKLALIRRLCAPGAVRAAHTPSLIARPNHGAMPQAFQPQVPSRDMS
jgi:hypothetical protein